MTNPNRFCKNCEYRTFDGSSNICHLNPGGIYVHDNFWCSYFSPATIEFYSKAEEIKKYVEPPVENEELLALRNENQELKKQLTETHYKLSFLDMVYKTDSVNFSNRLNEFTEELQNRRQRITELESALVPFAKIAGSYSKYFPLREEDLSKIVWGYNTETLCWRDFDTALRLLEDKEND